MHTVQDAANETPSVDGADHVTGMAGVSPAAQRENLDNDNSCTSPRSLAESHRRGGSARSAAGTVLVASGPAGAVHDDNLFELGPTPAPPTNIVGDGVAANGPDWTDIFNASGE